MAPNASIRQYNWKVQEVMAPNASIRQCNWRVQEVKFKTLHRNAILQ